MLQLQMLQKNFLVLVLSAFQVDKVSMLSFSPLEQISFHCQGPKGFVHVCPFVTTKVTLKMLHLVSSFQLQSTFFIFFILIQAILKEDGLNAVSRYNLTLTT